MDTNGTDKPLSSAEHWEALADREELQAKWDRDHGFDLSAPGMSSGDYRAQTYRRVARALRLEAETGKAHCSICLKDHPNHLHMHQG